MKSEECSCSVNSELFGRRGGFFDEAIAPLWSEVYDSLVARADVCKGSSVLDLGTGSGEVAIRLARAVGRKGKVLAIDEQSTMLGLARRKSRSRGLNIEFEQMSMEKMDLPVNRFDSVLANYSLCCCMDYRAALKECLRVLRPGGRLTYNHGGPSDPLANQVIFSLFEAYKSRSPSRKLREFRRLRDAQVEAFRKYRDPFTCLELMRSLGFENSEATLSRHSLRYKGARIYVDEWISFDWSPEAEEISAEDLRRFRSEAIRALAPLSKEPGFVVERDVVYFTGLKPSDRC